MVVCVDDEKYIPAVVKLANELLPCRHDTLENLLHRTLHSPKSLLLVSIDDKGTGDVTGYLYAMIMPWQGETVAFVESVATQRGRVDRKEKLLAYTLLSEWARASAAVKILARTKLDPRVFAKYGFNLTGYIIERPLC
jgi:hypothetical protein